MSRRAAIYSFAFALLGPPVGVVLASGCGQATVEERTVTIDVGGMVCTSCEQGINHALGKLDGVLASTVDHKTGKAEVRFNAKKIEPSMIVETIEGLGFTASLAG